MRENMENSGFCNKQTFQSYCERKSNVYFTLFMIPEKSEFRGKGDIIIYLLLNAYLCNKMEHGTIYSV